MKKKEYIRDIKKITLILTIKRERNRTTFIYYLRNN